MPEGTFCHKPCTVSGGGKSEISKSLVDAVLPGSVLRADFDEDMAQVEAIFEPNYDDACRDRARGIRAADPVARALARLGDQAAHAEPDEFTPEYNAWLESIPNHVRALVFVIKRFYRPEWGDDWRRHFSVDIINGAPGHELKYEGRKLVGNYLRVGLEENGAWRTYKLRQDFVAADKVQMEDDITASVVVPARRLVGLPGRVRRAPEPQARRRTASSACSSGPTTRSIPASTARPRRTCRAGALLLELPAARAARTRSGSSRTSRSTTRSPPPMREHVDRNAARTDDGYSICSANPRLIGGKPTKNPRYLQVRPDLARPRDRYVAEMGARLQPAAAAGAAGGLPGDQRALRPAEQPARGRDPPALRLRTRSTTRSCPSCSWTTCAP